MSWVVWIYVPARDDQSRYGEQHKRPVKRSFETEEAYQAYLQGVEDARGGVFEVLNFEDKNGKKADNRRPRNRQADG